MTAEEIEKRFKAIEHELLQLKWEMLKQAGVDVIPGFGVVGRFKDDPDFAEAVRLGREWRERVNRESLEEMDREDGKADKPGPNPKRRKKPKPRNTDASVLS